MKEFENWFDVLIFSAQNILVQFLGFTPKVIAAIILFFIGWLIAKGLEKLANKVLNVIGVNSISEKAGIEGFLKSSGFSSPLSYIFARILFWTVIILFLLPVSDILGFQFFANIVNQIINYLPNLFVAILILLIGSWGAKIISGIVKGGSNRIGLENSELLGSISSILIIIITFIIALTQLRIEAEILTSILLILIASIGIALAISFGVGSKDIFKNIIAGVYLNKAVRKGENVKFANIEGKILHVGTILTKIETLNNLEISVPNNHLIETVVN